MRSDKDRRITIGDDEARRPRCGRREGFALSLLVALAFAAGCRTEPELAPPRDVVLIVVDTLRADHVGAYGYPLPTTPFLDSLAERGTVFENAFAPSSHTAPSHASMFTSLYPESHGVLRNGAPLRGEGVTTLAEALRDRGFATALFPSVNFLSELAEGFEHVEHWVWTDRPDYRRAAATVQTAIDWLESTRERPSVFLVVHLYDVHDHSPRSSPPVSQMNRIRRAMRDDGEPFRRHVELVEPEPEKIGSLRRQFLRYDAQLAYVDLEIARLYEAFGRLRGHEETLWIVTSDHGEGLGDHGLVGHGQHLYNEQLRVPLIVHAPSWDRPAARVPQLVRLIDLFPTVLELAGAERSAAEQTMEGVSLAPLLVTPEASLDIDYVYAQRRPVDARRAERWEPGLVISAQSLTEKIIYRENGPAEYYDLSRDPNELTNLAEGLPPDEVPAEAERLRRWLLDTYSRTHAERPEGSGEVRPEHLEELEALGYLD